MKRPSPVQQEPAACGSGSKLLLGKGRRLVKEVIRRLGFGQPCRVGHPSGLLYVYDDRNRLSCRLATYKHYIRSSKQTSARRKRLTYI